MNLPAATCGVSGHLTFPSLPWEGTKGRVRYSSLKLISLRERDLEGNTAASYRQSQVKKTDRHARYTKIMDNASGCYVNKGGGT
jgi:hypothetical protein